MAPAHCVYFNFQLTVSGHPGVNVVPHVEIMVLKEDLNQFKLKMVVNNVQATTEENVTNSIVNSLKISISQFISTIAKSNHTQK